MFVSYGNSFRIEFDNGYKVSVAWRNGNYANIESRNDDGSFVASTAEVAVFGPNNKMVDLTEESPVLGYQTPEEVLKILNRAAAGNF